MARSRWTWPRPMGEEIHSARRGRLCVACQTVCLRGRWTIPSTKSRMTWFTATGYRTCGACPPPSITSSSALVSSAIRRTRSGGTILS